MSKEKDKKTNAMRILDAEQITYQMLFYECEEFIDGIEATNKLEIPQEESYKTLVTIGKSREYYVFVIPVAQELNMKKAARITGEKSLEMLHVKEILGVTGYVRGGVSPLGMKKHYPTFIHDSAVQLDTIVVSGGKKGCSISLLPFDLKKAASAAFADLV